MRKILDMFLLLLMTVAVHAEEPDFSFPVDFKGEEPTIGDFVTAICNTEYSGEWMANVGEEWGKKQKGEQTMGCFSISRSNDNFTYIRQDNDNGHSHKGTTEFRCWRCSDGQHWMVAEASNFYNDGVAYAGQYTGVSLYLYDADTKRMEMVYGSDYGMEGAEIDALFTYSLTRKGITGIADKPEGGKCRMKYEWNGKTFVKK